MILGKFDGYSLRSIEESDYQQLKQWIAADPVHASILDPEFFMGQAIDQAGQLAEDPRVSVFALIDRRQTLMYIRLSRASRVHIQFPPTPEVDGTREKNKARYRHYAEISNALIKGMAFLEVGLANAGCTEWIFDTEAQQLRNLVQRRMDFAPSPMEMVRIIPRLGLQQPPENSLPTAPQQPEKEA